MAEELTEYLLNHGVKANYIHSDVATLDRVKIMNDLREGIFDVLVGVNLLREGLDLPEVSLVAILDADKECGSECQRNGDYVCRSYNIKYANDNRRDGKKAI